MRLVSYLRDGNVKPGMLLDGNKVIDIWRLLSAHAAVNPAGEPSTVPCSLMEVILESQELLGRISAAMEFFGKAGLLEGFCIDGAKPILPFVPGKLICLGRNYALHAAESGYDLPREPIIFLKASSCLIGPEEDIVYPSFVERLDPEVELAVVIGRLAKGVKREAAYDYVFGYCILNDVTARDMQERDIAARNPWFRSKSLDTFGPFGPCVVTRDELPDPHKLGLELRVNGEVRQKDTTADMIFDIPTLIEFISGLMTLYPGDVISTGTPHGIAPIKVGDVVEAEVEGIGVLRNKVVRG